MVSFRVECDKNYTGRVKKKSCYVGIKKKMNRDVILLMEKNRSSVFTDFKSPNLLACA